MNTPTTFSAVPTWLQEVLPQWFVDRPAFTEAVYATAKSATYGIAILVVAAAQEGAFATFHGTAAWVATNWWGLVTAGAIAALRGREAHSKASTVGAATPLPPPKEAT